MKHLNADFSAKSDDNILHIRGQQKVNWLFYESLLPDSKMRKLDLIRKGKIHPVKGRKDPERE
jgi:hypothetical protein